MGFTRDTASYRANHTSASAGMRDLAAAAAAMQSQAASAGIRPSTFLGAADALSLDAGVFGGLVAVAVQLLLEAGDFYGRQFVSSGSPLGHAQPPRSGAPAPPRPASFGMESVAAVPQITAVKPPEKPFYLGLVDVPGIGYANTLFSRNEAGEFDPTRKSSEGLMTSLLRQPVSFQARSMTPAVVKLNINPTDITLTYAKKVNATRVRANYARRELAAGGKVTGHVIQHHWDELDVVSVTCVTGNFWVNGGLHYPRGEQAGFQGWYPTDADPAKAGFQSSAAPARGLMGEGSASRTKSLAYRKLQAIVAMFRNNGCSWLTGSTKLSSQQEQDFFGADFGVVVNPGAAFMLYDSIIWYGHFESMNVNERADLPNAIEFSWEFKVAKTIDLNGVSDSDVMLATDEMPSFFAQPPAAVGVSEQRPDADSLAQAPQQRLEAQERRDRVNRMLTSEQRRREFEERVRARAEAERESRLVEERGKVQKKGTKSRKQFKDRF